MVFLHGAGGNLATWKHQIAVFKPYFNLLLLDLRDHGQSKELVPDFPAYTFQIIRADIRAVLDQVGIQKAHFVTLSFGSVLVQDFQSHYPDRVDRIVMAGGIFDCNAFSKACVHLARFFNVFLPYKVMYRLFSYLLMPFRRNQLARKIYEKQAEKITPEAYLKWVALYGEFFYLLKHFRLLHLPIPVLVVMGQDDYVFLSSARRFAKSQPKSTLVVLPKVGHICTIESPDAFNSLALRFLTTEPAKPQIPVTTETSDTN